MPSKKKQADPRPTNPISQYLRAWLQAHPLISILPLENACGIPESNLMREDRDIAPKHLYRLCWHLADYGLTIGDWRLYRDPMGIIRHKYNTVPMMDENYRYHPEESRSIDDAHDFQLFLESHFK
jgi:hypothetical protein